MKYRLMGLAAMVFVVLSGCVTYRNFDEIKERQLSQDQEFKKTFATSQFTVANDPSGSSINLAYIQNYDAYTVTKYGRFQENYRIPTTYVLILYYRGEQEKTDEKEIKEWSTESLAERNAKSEQLAIEKGQTISLSFPSGPELDFTLSQDGLLALDDPTSTKILSTINSLDDLGSVRIGYSSLKLRQTVDLSAAQPFHAAFSAVADLQRTLDSYRVAASDSSQRYDNAQEALLSLVKKVHYGYELHLIQSAFDANFDTVASDLRNQIIALQNKMPTFFVEGQVNDQVDGFVQIWGTATPRPVTEQALRSPGCQMNPTNIIVNSPDDSNFRGNTFFSMTTYFLDRESGTNAMGGTVPIYRYTTKMLPSYQPIAAQITDLQAKLDALTKARSDASAQFTTN